MLAPYHDRMSVILKPSDYGVWPDAGVRRPELLMPCSALACMRR
jgi:putative SOS response-associated peptidase YedK